MSTTIGDGSAAERNKEPIFEALLPWLTAGARVLEIGAGNGVHARHATTHRPDLVWQTSEAPAHVRGLQAALVDQSGAALPAPIALDVRQRWPAERYTAIYGANITHIMDSAAVGRLFEQASAHLLPGGHLCLYGPFFEPETPAGEGNLRFDHALRARGVGMGLRQRDWLDALAETNGLAVAARLVMPSDNRLLIWSRS